jgi:hypothetical protein
MSRRISSNVQSARLQVLNSDAENKKAGSSRKVAPPKNRGEDKNREKKKRDSGAQSVRTSSRSGKRNNNRPEKGKLSRHCSCEERECSSSNRAEVGNRSRVPSRRKRGLGRKNGGNFESIQPVRFENNLILIPVRKGQQIFLVAPATATVVDGSGPKVEGAIDRVKRVSIEETIRILTRSLFKASFWVLISLVTLFILANRC